MKLRKSISLALTMALVVCAMDAGAQGYPNRPVRIIQGFAPAVTVNYSDQNVQIG